MLTNQQVLSSFDLISSSAISQKEVGLIYNSIDIRQSSFKIAPVDNNIFPAGFNNISAKSHGIFSLMMQEFCVKNNVKTVVIITEDHTRNEGYLQNVMFLFDVFAKNDLNVDIATLSLDEHSITVSGKTINISKLENFIGTKKIPKPDLIILNNDLSGQMIENEKLSAMLKMKNIMPSPFLGWNRRKKSDHFVAYSALVKSVSEKIGFDPWLIDAKFSTAECLNFSSQYELEKLTDTASDLFKQIKVKYKEYKIPNEPSIFLKSESGTYGLGVEKVSKPEDLLNPNRTFRKKILYNKSKIANTQFLLQEAVPTQITYQNKTAECTFYASFGKVFGGFYRIHGTKNDTDNLNARGAEFAPVETIEEKSLPVLIATLSSVAVLTENHAN